MSGLGSGTQPIADSSGGPGGAYGSVAGADSLIPLERVLQERLEWFIRLRWLAAVGVLVGPWASAVLLVALPDSGALRAVGVAIGAYNAAFLLARRWLRRAGAGVPHYRRFAYVQIALDWVALLCLVHYAGGIQSSVSLAFLFHVTIGSILLSRRACYVQALLASLLLLLLLGTEHAGYWSHAAAESSRLSPMGGLVPDLQRWVVLSLLLAVNAFLTTSIATPLRQKEEWLFRSEHELERANGELEALYRMGQAVNATLELDQVLGLIAENGARLMGMRACSIRLLEESGQVLRMGAAYGLSQEYLEKGPVEVNKSPIDAEALAGHTVQVTNVAEDPRVQYSQEARDEGIHSMLCAPLQARGRSIGRIRVYSAEPHQFSSGDERLLRNLANLGATAIVNARAYAEVQAIGEERAWFARVTHHQLRAPLAAVRSMLDALRYGDPLTEKQADFIARSRRRVDELLDMIRDLLDLAAAQRPVNERQAEAVGLAACLERPIEAARMRAAGKGVTLELELAPEARVLADPGDIERVFANLLDNAVKYTPAGGRAEFRAWRDAGQVTATVTDTGIGIAAEDQEAVFRGFYRTQEAKETGELGTGIGLSIVQKLVKRWGGTLDLVSAPGRGSRFTVRIPATD